VLFGGEHLARGGEDRGHLAGDQVEQRLAPLLVHQVLHHREGLRLPGGHPEREAVHRVAGLFPPDVVGADADPAGVLRGRVGAAQDDPPRGHAKVEFVQPHRAGEVLHPGQLGGGERARAAEELLRRAARGDRALVEHHQLAADPVDLVAAVRNEEDRAVEVGQRIHQLLFHLHPEETVQRRERLVEHDDLRRRKQHPPDRRALLLAAAQPVRFAVGFGGEVHPLEHRGGAFAPFLPRQVAQHQFEVFADGHGGEERVLLEEVADFPLLRRQVDPLFGIEQHAAVEDDPPGVGRFDPGDAFERHALAASGSAEQPHALRTGGEGDVERERCQFFAEGDLKHDCALPRS